MARTATHTLLEAQGGCYPCALEKFGDGSRVLWRTRNALALAARHNKATGHDTWADVIMKHAYRGKG